MERFPIFRRMEIGKRPGLSPVFSKQLQRPEVLNALVLRVFVSPGLDRISSLLADQETGGKPGDRRNVPQLSTDETW